MRNLEVVAAALVIMGVLKFGAAGAFDRNLVAALFGMRFGDTSAASTVVYSLIGLVGLYQSQTWKAIQRRWQPLTPLGADHRPISSTTR